MRKICQILIVLSLVCLSMTETKAQMVNIKGVINGYESGVVQLIGGSFTDTLQVDAKGRFTIHRQMEFPQVVMVLCEQFRSAFNMYMENGMKGKLTVSFRAEPYEGQTMYVAEPVYKGSLEDCFEFQRDFDAWEREGWSFDKIAQYDFLTYRELLDKDVNTLRNRLMALKSDGYKRIILPRLERRAEDNVMRFAWAKHTVDPDFEKYISSFERNDMKNYGMASTYQRWWQGTHRPQEGFTNGSWYMYGLRQNFTNQQMINELAADFMAKYIPRAPKDLSEAWEAFRKTCTDEKKVERLQSMYDKFNPGKDAPDFETVGYEDGKVYTLKDFRGKALMIDCWATWCGPCMAEMPYFANLVEHFKGDDRIELIGISFDNDRKRLDKELGEHPHPWRQFWCKDAFSSTIAKAYGFNGIPRFIFIDKNGKLIAGDAPKPSSENIIEYIESKLALSDK